MFWGEMEHFGWSLVYDVITALFLIMIAVIVAFFLGVGVFIRKLYTQRNDPGRHNDQNFNVGFFHPYCNAGGGGERVLWCAVRALLNKHEAVRIHIYTGDIDAKPEKILQNAQNTFNIKLNEKRINFIYLKRRNWIEAKYYSHFTLLMQSLGSIVLAIEALLKYQPDIFIDTMGYAFTLPMFKYFGGCKVACYVHYPTISVDMLKRVKSRIESHNNRGLVAKNPFLTWLKLTYYRLFAKLYGWVGRSAESIMVNSSWTENHILNLWNCPFKTYRIYPPCPVQHLLSLQHIDPPENKINILSISQFRPEKDHPLQLQALYELRTMLNDNEDLWSRVKLIIVGSCRHYDDEKLLKNMQDLSKHLSLEENVEFRVNVSHQELIQCYQNASIGLHTMWNEHFGIGIVESMAAGLIMVANRSGGPLMDIIETAEGSKTGYLATDALEYAECLLAILYGTVKENDGIRAAARASCERFSEKEFEIAFLRAISPLTTLIN